jgi:hypothetical protein
MGCAKPKNYGEKEFCDVRQDSISTLLQIEVQPKTVHNWGLCITAFWSQPTFSEADRQK